MSRPVIRNLATAEASRHLTGSLVVETPGQGFLDITEPIARFLRDSRLASGLATLFCRHTSCSLVIQENADPDVRRDLLTSLDRLAPRGAGYVHDQEGPDDMPAHIRTMLTGVSLGIPFVAGRLALGTWQGIYLAEHRDAPHRREIVVNLNGA